MGWLTPLFESPTTPPTPPHENMRIFHGKTDTSARERARRGAAKKMEKQTPLSSPFMHHPLSEVEHFPPPRKSGKKRESEIQSTTEKQNETERARRQLSSGGEKDLWDVRWMPHNPAPTHTHPHTTTHLAGENSHVCDFASCFSVRNWVRSAQHIHHPAPVRALRRRCPLCSQNLVDDGWAGPRRGRAKERRGPLLRATRVDRFMYSPRTEMKKGVFWVASGDSHERRMCVACVWGLLEWI